MSLSSRFCGGPRSISRARRNGESLPTELAWGGRREFDLDDDYDRAAAYKIVLDEGTAKNLQELVNGRLLEMMWPQNLPARPVRILWERMFPQLRATA